MATPDKSLRQAVYARFYDGLAWYEIARRTAISERTLYQLRKTARWQDAVAGLLADVKAEALPAEYGYLTRAATRNAVQAARVLVERFEAAELGSSTDSDLPAMTDEELDPRSSARLAAVAVQRF